MTNVTIDDNSNNHFYNEYLNKLNKNKKICQLAAEYYERNYNLLNIPTILLTSLTGIGSFCNTSELISNETKLYLSLTIGIIGSIFFYNHLILVLNSILNLKCLEMQLINMKYLLPKLTLKVTSPMKMTLSIKWKRKY